VGKTISARYARWAAAVLAALAVTTGAFAQDASQPDKVNAADLQRQIGQMQQMLQQQQQQLQQLQQLQQQQSTGASLSPAIEPVAAQMPQAPSGAAGGAPASGPPPGATKDWFEVGSDLRMTASWKDGFLVQTANKDFWTHIGGWLQYDNYWLSA
jgi:TolA-binding protein